MGKEIIKQIKVFLGPEASGKTRLAREVAENYPKEKVTFLQHRDLKTRYPQFMFSDCTPNTRLLIIDDIQGMEALLNYIIWTHRYIHVERQLESPFIISPEVILICDASITREQLDALGTTITNRCTLIEVDALELYNAEKEEL